MWLKVWHLTRQFSVFINLCKNWLETCKCFSACKPELSYHFFIEIDDTNSFERICLTLVESLAKSELHRWSFGWWCIYQSAITSCMSLSSERELTLTRSKSRFMCCWDVPNCHRPFMSDLVSDGTFITILNSLYPLDYSTCKTLILLLIAVLLVYTIVDCEVLMRETHSKQWCGVLANREI